MDTITWEDVLIQWVNCLKLSKPIQTLKALQTGNFFHNLTKLLLNTSDLPTDTGNYIFSLIRKEYPRITFEATSPNLDRTTYTDLVTITSLLMHHSCIADRRDALTSPLCNELPPKTQAAIKIFLEKVHSNVTNERVTSIVDDCLLKVRACSNDIICHWVASGDSPLSSRSPLQEFLYKTPIARKAVLHEKEKELSKLRQELEVERFEKSDLQEELKVQYETNAKLDKQLAQKMKEIKVLRGEIVGLENKTPPHVNGPDSVQMQKRMKAEIDSLEIYIARQQSEFELLKDEKCKAMERMKKLETDCQLWQERALSTESSCETMEEQLQKQEQEMLGLQMHCKELSDMLEGLRNNDKHETSVPEWSDSATDMSGKSFVSAHSMEDLAQTVVDVQLKDAQKENLELKATLKENVRKSESLSEELTCVKKKLTDLGADYTKLQSDNELLLRQVAQLAEVERDLSLVRQQLTKSCEEIHAHESKAGKRDSEIRGLRRELAESVAAIEDGEQAKKMLRYDVEKLLVESRNDKLALDEGQKLYERVRSEADSLQRECAALTADYNKTSFELQNMKRAFEEFNAHLEANFRNLESVVLDQASDENAFEWNDVRFRRLCEHINTRRSLEIKDRKVLLEKIEVSEELIRKLESEVGSLRDRERVNLEERHVLKTHIENAETVTAELKATISKYASEIKTLNATINDMKETIDDLNLLKDVIKEKEHEIKSLHKRNEKIVHNLAEAQTSIMNLKDKEAKTNNVIADLENLVADLERKVAASDEIIKEHERKEKKLSKSVEELKTFKTSLETQLEDAKREIADKSCALQQNRRILDELDAVRVSLEEELNGTNKLHDEREKQTLEMVKQLNQQNESYCKKLKRLEKNWETTDQNYKKVLKQLEDVQAEKNTIEESMREKVAHYEKNIEVLRMTIARLENEAKETADERQRLSLLNKKIDDERLQKTTQCDELRQYIEQIQLLLSIKEEECVEKDAVVDKCNQELLVLKLKLEEKRIRLQDTKSNLDMLNLKLDSSANMIDVLNSRLDEQTTETKLLAECKATLETKCEEFAAKNGRLLESLDLERERLAVSKREHEHTIAALERDKHKLEGLLEKSNENIVRLTERGDADTRAFTAEIEALKRELEEVNSRFEAVNLREIENLEEIRFLKDELNKTVENYTQALEAQQELRSEYELQIHDLQENLHHLVEKHNNSERQHAALAESLTTTERRISDLELEKIGLERKLAEQLQEFEQSCEVLKKEMDSAAKLERQKLKQIISDLNNEYDHFKGDSKEKIGKLEAVLQVKKEEKAALKRQLGEALAEVAKLQDEYKKLNDLRETYVEESRSKLLTTQENLKNQIDIMRKNKEDLEQTVSEQKIKIDTLTTERDELVNRYTTEMSEKETRYAALEQSYKDSQEKMKNLLENQQFLEEQCKNWQKLHHDSSKTTADYEQKIANAKCAQEILQTGKQMLETEIRNLVDELNSVRKDLHDKETEFGAIVDEKDAKIALMEAKLKDLDNRHAQKQDEITSLNRRFDAVSKALDALRGEQAELERAWKKEKELFEEEYKTLEQTWNDGNSEYLRLKHDYDQLVDRLGSLKSDKRDLEDQICSYIRGEEIMKNAIKDYESSLLEKNQELNSLKLILQTNESTILELNNKIEDGLKTFAKFELEKHNLQAVLVRTRTDLDEAIKNRDEILEGQTKAAKEAENSVLRAHENANELLKRVQVLNVDKSEIERTLVKEVALKDTLERRVLELENERCKFVQLCVVMDTRIRSLEYVLGEKTVECRLKEDVEFNLASLEGINEAIGRIERRVMEILEKKRALVAQVATYETEQTETAVKIERLMREKDDLMQEKERLINNYDLLSKEKLKLTERTPNKSTNKENILLQQQTNTSTSTEDDWKRKYFAMKQKLTLADNVKANLEQKLRQLRESHKQLNDNVGTITREEHENMLEAIRSKYSQLEREHEELAKRLAGQNASDRRSNSETEKLRKAYANVVSEKSKLELQVVALKKDLEELVMIKEAYERLVEENNKLLTEIDTVNYKRSRDREELAKVLKKDREHGDLKHNAKIQEIRTEYEAKLEKMKEKMIKLYKDEVDKEMQKLSAEKNENMFLLRTIEQLKEHLKTANMRAHEAELERDKTRDSLMLQVRKQQPQANTGSHDSLYSRPPVHPKSPTSTRGSRESLRTRDSVHPCLPTGPRVGSRDSIGGRRIDGGITITNDGDLVVHRGLEDRKLATLPRSNRMDVIEEITICRRRTSINALPADIGKNLKMEDEEDDFNNKYLSDLKAGRCILPSGKESNANRLSELAWRNSLCPPHLKSSYPAETQFTSPTRFREDDIKSGNVDHTNDSMSVRLLPGEKSRIKKDAGTTSYKKPGPPTPSKNGGRQSLQGTDPHRDHAADSKTPKRVTPNRLRALFMGRNSSSTREQSESQQSTTPKSKRLNIFRKPH